MNLFVLQMLESAELAERLTSFQELLSSVDIIRKCWHLPFKVHVVWLGYVANQNTAHSTEPPANSPELGHVGLG
jgi:hypothetical protein